MAILIKQISSIKQYIYCLLMVSFTVAVSTIFVNNIDYHITAFFLLLIVSVAAVLFDILPVLFTALISALAWNFFFIPPRFTLHIDKAEDLIFFLMYFVIALINAILTNKIRKTEKELLIKVEKENTIKLYNTLLNSLSHELRTPIAAIIGATDNLQNFNSRLTELNRFELVNEIAKASFRLNQQVENLLNMSRLESGILKPKKDWCDITELIYNTVKNVEENTGSKNINIQADPSIPLFKIDKTMLEQVIYNLLYNAVVHTNEDAKIKISALCQADMLEINIEDNAQGFPADEIKYVFDKFYRLKNARAGGTGLGLSIVKGFVEAHNGTVTLKNKNDGGALFTIHILAETSYLNHLKNE